jgi:hypothetical protein
VVQDNPDSREILTAVLSLPVAAEEDGRIRQEDLTVRSP